MFKIAIVIVSLLNPADHSVLFSERSFTKETCEAKLAEIKPRLEEIGEQTHSTIQATCFAPEGQDI